ncbi:MAG: N-acetyl-alpha-D-glucosaminyl L-malate deacetylase 1 [Patescibacteria group bacterium]|nr:MAG: N-acetyl-alpha-D-glucosaminyl L-malate deacetylase 1 [Patescibacteria group bacterium]
MKKSQKINVLAVGAHPDDVEACAAGFLIKAKKKGLTTGIIDMTLGESSNFGTVAERKKEAKEAAKILNLDTRVNQRIPDGHVLVSEENIFSMVKAIRKLRPDIILAPYYNDLHPDHANTGLIVKKATFFAKIQKYSPINNLEPHQPGMLLFYMLHTEFTPSFILDISEEYQTKLRSIYAHKSQFFKKGKTGYTKEFHNPDFMEFFNSRSRVYGYKIGAEYGEPYLLEGYLGLKGFEDLMSGSLRSLASWRKY